MGAVHVGDQSFLMRLTLVLCVYVCVVYVVCGTAEMQEGVMGMGQHVVLAMLEN